MVGEAQVRLAGSVTLDSDGNVSVPSLALLDAVAQQETIFVTRRTNTSVGVTSPAGLEQLPLEESRSQHIDLARQLEPAESGRGDRLVAAFSGIERTAPLELSVTPNRPQTDTVQLMSIERADAGWTGTFDSEITTRGGTLEELRFGLAENWTGPFSIEPSMPSEVIDLPNKARILVLHPPAPIAGTARLRIHGTLKTDGSQPLRVPEIRLDGAQSTRDFLVLPTQYNMQQFVWDTRGLVEEPLPKIFEPPTARPNHKTYLRAAPRATGELKSIQKLADNAHVRVADVALAWHADGSCYGAASFDLEPAGIETCLLALPPNFELVYVATDGISQLRQPIANLRWRISLAGARLPLRIDVVYRGRLPDNMRDVPHEALAPWLVGLPIEKTLWTISGPRWAGLPTIDANHSLSAAEAEIFRLKATTSLIETATTTMVEQSTDNVVRWYRPWLDRWLTARAAAKRPAVLAPPDGDAGNVTDQVTREESKHMRLARRIEAWPGVEPVWNQTPTLDNPLRSWQRSIGRSHDNAHAILAGGAFAPVLEYTRAYADDWASRIGQAAIACVVVLLIGWAIRVTRLGEAFDRWPQAAVIAFGLFWWLWISPSAVGWLFVALGALGPRIDRVIGALVRRFRPTSAKAR